MIAHSDTSAERGRRREKDLVARLQQYFIDIADEASLWPANIINLGSIYPRLWWRMADPKKKERVSPHVRAERAKWRGEYRPEYRHIFWFSANKPHYYLSG